MKQRKTIVTSSNDIVPKRGRPFGKYGKYKKTLQKEALENAQQIKSWNKFGSTDFSYVYVFMAGIILGLAVACIVVTPSIIEAIG